MQLTDAQTKKLLEYNGPIQLKQLALNMALTRMKNLYKQSPGPVTVTKCTMDLNAMLQKFSSIMQPDYDWITKL